MKGTKPHKDDDRGCLLQIGQVPAADKSIFTGLFNKSQPCSVYMEPLPLIYITFNSQYVLHGPTMSTCLDCGRTFVQLVASPVSVHVNVHGDPFTESQIKHRFLLTVNWCDSDLLPTLLGIQMGVDLWSQCCLTPPLPCAMVGCHWRSTVSHPFKAQRVSWWSSGGTRLPWPWGVIKYVGQRARILPQKTLWGPDWIPHSYSLIRIERSERFWFSDRS